MADFEKSIEMEEIYAPFVPDEDHYIFVSYSHADRERVFPIITRLYEKGWHIWYDQGIPYGENYDEVIMRHLDDCDVFLLFITDNSVISEYVSKREMPHACNVAKTIIQCQMDVGTRFPDVIQRKLDFATEMSEFHPKASEADLEIVLGSFVQCFEPRKANGFWNLTKASEIPAWEENESFEYIKKKNGICLCKYLGKDEIVSVPPVYKGFPVIEMDDTFYGNNTIETVYVAEGIKKLSFHCFSDCPNLTDLYLPNSYSVNCMDKWDYEINAIRTIRHKVTLHCMKGSDAYRLANRLKWKTGGLKIKTDYPNAASALETCITRNCVYCSMSEQDVERYKGILQRLKDLGCTILDSVSVPSSKKLKTFLDSRVFLAFISRSYLASSELQYLELSCQTDKDQILWLMEDCQLPAKISLRVENEQQIRYDNGTQDEQILKLVEALQKKGCVSAVTDTQEYDYRVTKDGLFLSAYHGKSVELHIPESISGIPVIGIENLRLEISNTKQVILPNGLKYIGEMAFFNCTWLREISLPGTLTNVGDAAFKGCSNLLEISLPDGLSSIGRSAFTNCLNLRMVAIPFGVAKIGDHAFSDCKSLYEISIPDSVSDIGAYVFCDATTVICSQDSYAWRYCERKEIPHKTPAGVNHKVDPNNGFDFEDILRIFK